MTPAFGHREDRDFIGFDVKIFGNSIGERWNGELIVVASPYFRLLARSSNSAAGTFAHGLVKGDLN